MHIGANISKRIHHSVFLKKTLFAQLFNFLHRYSNGFFNIDNPMRYLQEYINPGLLACLILCFFLPFVSIKCNGEMELLKKTGVQMAFGLKPESKVKDLMSMMGGGLDSSENLLMQEKFDRPDIFSILALFLLSLGIVFRFIPRVNKPIVFFFLNLSLVVVLVIMQLILNRIWANEMKKMEAELVSIRLTLHFTMGYWIVLIGAALLAVLNFISFKKSQNNFEESPLISEEI